MASAVRAAAGIRPETRQTPAQRLAFWSSVASAIASAGFGVGVAATLLAFPQVAWKGDIAAYARGYDPLQMAVTVVPSLLLAPAFLALTAAVHALAEPERRLWTHLAAMAATVYAGIVGVNYFLQLTVVRQDMLSGSTEGMALFAMANPASIFWALEILGYFCQGAAAALLATVFTGSRLATWLRWMLIAVFVTGALGIVAALPGIDFTNPVFAAGAGAWALVFPISMVLSAVYFRRHAAG